VTQATGNKSKQRSYAAIIMEFLGSMNLAITLLVAIAIAAIIGTVLKQNEPYNNYIIKFGTFWFEMFRDLRLYDVYGAAWFMSLLGILLVSTSVCVYRNGPVMLRDMRQFRLKVAAKSLRLFHHHAEWHSDQSIEQVQQQATDLLKKNGYRVRTKDHGDHVVLAAMKGGINRLGYLFTHVAIVVICIGALIDSNPILNYKISAGDIKILPNSAPPSKATAKSILSEKNPAFRGTVRIPEKESADRIFINKQDGYLIQLLPFRVQLDDFRIEHYATGQPKSFESDIEVFDKSLKEPIRKTIRVNEPLLYRGYAIYQSSFADGGSQLKLKLWPLYDPAMQTLAVDGDVYTSMTIESGESAYQVELEDFRLFNINPVEAKEGEKKFKNFGPNFTFKLRDSSGVAKEYVNYMSPIQFDGRLYYLSGVRSSEADDFQYLYIPADAKGSLDRFMKFRAKIQDRLAVRKIASQTATDLVASTSGQGKNFAATLVTTITRLMQMYTKGGLDAIGQHIQKNVPQAQRQTVANTYLRILRESLGALYLDTLKDEGVDISKGVSKDDTAFFDESFDAMNKMSQYGSPFYLQLSDFKHIQASGLQITRSPGKNIVYLGCALLIFGVFMMFYVIHRRYWVYIRPEGEQLRVIFAGMGNRNVLDFEHDYKKLEAYMQTRLQGRPAE
jgi:cytochrome c biogenesis protein